MNRYKRCSYCDIQLQNSTYPYFYKPMKSTKLCCNDEKCMRKLLLEITERVHLT